jgi:hypothetical protein
VLEAAVRAAPEELRDVVAGAAHESHCTGVAA